MKDDNKEYDETGDSSETSQQFETSTETIDNEGQEISEEDIGDIQAKIDEELKAEEKNDTDTEDDGDEKSNKKEEISEEDIGDIQAKIEEDLEDEKENDDKAEETSKEKEEITEEDIRNIQAKIEEDIDNDRKCGSNAEEDAKETNEEDLILDDSKQIDENINQNLEENVKENNIDNLDVFDMPHVAHGDGNSPPGGSSNKTAITNDSELSGLTKGKDITLNNKNVKNASFLKGFLLSEAMKNIMKAEEENYSTLGGYVSKKLMNGIKLAIKPMSMLTKSSNLKTLGDTLKINDYSDNIDGISRYIDLSIAKKFPNEILPSSKSELPMREPIVKSIDEFNNDDLDNEFKNNLNITNLHSPIQNKEYDTTLAKEENKKNDLSPMQEMSEYLGNHNYGIDDKDKYMADPIWQKLNSRVKDYTENIQKKMYGISEFKENNDRILNDYKLSLSDLIESDGNTDKNVKDLIDDNNIYFNEIKDIKHISDKEYKQYSQNDINGYSANNYYYLRDYAKEGYIDLNKYLCNKENNKVEFYPEKIEMLELKDKEISKVLDNRELPEDLKLYRGINSPRFIFGNDWKDKSIEDLQNEFIGKIIYSDGYSSTSIDRSVAESFSNNWGGSIMEINAPKGANGMFMGELSSFDEKEVLLHKGSGYRINGIRADERNGTGYVIDCTLIGRR